MKSSNMTGRPSAAGGPEEGAALGELQAAADGSSADVLSCAALADPHR
jgi:hypothetical protein